MGEDTINSPRAPVAAVVVSWNCAGLLRDCLESLRSLKRPPQEVVVVDNGSTDGSCELVRDEFPEVRLLANGENLGFCRANNVGINATSAPFVLVLNPDTRLEPGFLEALLQAFEDPRVGIASGKLVRFDGRTLDSCGQQLGRSRQPIDRGYGRPDSGQFDRDDEVFGACGAAALYRRKMLKSIADPGATYFDETFFAFYEDLDLAWRARRRGWSSVYRHRAVGFHARGATAETAKTGGRVAAMLGRGPEIRFHIVKNRYLTILRNDTIRAYLRNLPFIWSRDAATFVLLLLASPSVLLRLWKERRLFEHALQRRRLDSSRPKHEVQPGVPTGAPPGGSCGSDAPNDESGTDGSSLA
jgi:GT2 family glycosyltransferase